MAIGKETKVLGINGLKMTPIDADGNYVTTPEEILKVPGAQSLSLSPTFIEKDLRGDEMILDVYSRLEGINFSFSQAKLDLKQLKTFLGGDYVETAETSPGAGDAVNSFTLEGDDLPEFFMLEGVVNYTEKKGGNLIIILFKCKVTQFDVEFTGEEYATISVSGTAIPNAVDGNKVHKFEFNEKARDLFATEPVTEPDSE